MAWKHQTWQTRWTWESSRLARVLFTLTKANQRAIQAPLSWSPLPPDSHYPLGNQIISTYVHKIYKCIVFKDYHQSIAGHIGNCFSNQVPSIVWVHWLVIARLSADCWPVLWPQPKPSVNYLSTDSWKRPTDNWQTANRLLTANRIFRGAVLRHYW